MDELEQRLRDAAQEDMAWLVRVRRDLHRHPEPAWAEYRTAALAAQTLEDNTIKWIIYAGVLAICIYFNVRLMMSAGALHYKSYLSGEVRRNSNLSVKEGKDYKEVIAYMEEKEGKAQENPFKRFTSEKE